MLEQELEIQREILRKYQDLAELQELYYKMLERINEDDKERDYE